MDDAKSARCWQPVLEGEQRGAARDAVTAIADALRDPQPSWHSLGHRPDLPFALGSAEPWTALLYAYLGDDGALEQAQLLVDQAVESLASRTRGEGLYGGLAGVAWLVAHLSEWDPDQDVTEFSEIDAALEESLAREPVRGHYDLIGGAVGVGVYFLERLPAPAARRGLEAVVRQLSAISEPRPPGLTWFTPPEMLPPHQREEAPAGYFNLGVAHGVAGIVGLLGQICRAGVATEEARRLLEGAVPWMLAQRLPDAGAPAFPAWVAPGVRPSPCRVAWCYGDLGLALALLNAARCVGQRSWEVEALAIARRCLARPLDGVEDAALCHGASGNAHLFNRLFQATGEPAFGDAARTCFGKTFEMRNRGQGIAGYQSFWGGAPLDGGASWRDEPGFLTGAAGIGLALLAAISDDEPLWDRLLLAAVP